MGWRPKMSEPDETRRNGGLKLEGHPVTLFVLGLVATLGSVLSLATLSGGADVVRRNALDELRVAGLFVLAAMLLAGIAAVFPLPSVRGIHSSRFILGLSFLAGIVGLGVAGYGVLQPSRGRPSISVELNPGVAPTLSIAVAAGGLKSDDELNLLAIAHTHKFGTNRPRDIRLIREYFGPDPAGEARLQVQVPVPTGKQYQAVTIRAWVGKPTSEGVCLFQMPDPEQLRATTRLGCLILSLESMPAESARLEDGG